MPRPSAALSSFAILSSLALGAETETFDAASAKLRTPSFIALKAGEIDLAKGEPAVAALLEAAEPGPGERGIYLLKLRGDVTETRKQLLREQGLDLLDYLPVNTFVVRGRADAIASARALRDVAWVGLLHPAYKIDPAIGTRKLNDGRDPAYVYLDVAVWQGEDVSMTARAIAAAGADVSQVWDDGLVRRIRARALPSLLPALARIPAVSFLEEVGQVTLRNNNTTWVLQTNVQDLRSIWDKGIHGEGQIIGHIDEEIDRDHCMFVDPIDNTPGPNHRKLVGYHSSTGFGTGSHGTHTAGTAAGDQEPITGSKDQNGHAYKARISTSNLNDITGWSNTPSNLSQYLTTQHDEGAHVHTNSWGEDFTQEYTSFCVEIDTFSRANEDDLVMFAETNATGPVYTPENAKDCLGVGLTNPPPNQDTKPWGGSAPTADGRRKPEIFAPGSGTISASATTPCAFVSMGGTSMASPAITGNAALTRQYYTEGWYPGGAKVAANAFTPTGALLKATLMNATVDMTSIPGYPSNEEGWGRLLLENALYFAGDTRKLIVWDVRNGSGLSTGGMNEYRFNVDANTEELRVTMVFTDPPASLLASSAPINDVSLELEDPTGTVYLGNVFDTVAGQSQTGGSSDLLNTVEQALRKVPVVGTWKARVRAGNVPMGPQGYAIVVTGAVSPVGVSEEVVTGAGPGPSNAPVVKTWNHASPPTTVSTWPAYAGSGYGANVACADIVAGGTPEILTGPGPGAVYGPQVRAFQPTGTALPKVNFFAYGTLKDGVHGSGGDLDGDPHEEILTSPGPGAVFGPHIRGWNFDGVTLTSIPKISFFAYATLKYGARSAGGDVDGDGFAEIVTGAGAGAVFSAHVKTFNYDNSSVAGRASFFAFGAGQYGASVASGNTDADSADEILAAHGPDPTQPADVKGFDASGGVSNAWTVTPFTTLFGAEAAAGDVDLDGTDELIVAPGAGSANASLVRGYDIVGTGGVLIGTIDFTAYGSQTYGTKVAVGDIGI